MALQAGHLFGNYRIVRLIGEGGFGEVYLAENPLIERRAAVKVLHAAMAQDAELVRRFLNEARAASAIRHRNIIEVFDAGIAPEGAPYILMEFLEGVSLQKRLADKGRLALPQVLEIARQAGSALAAAHAAGIVHRDLKPENLFLVPDAGAPSGERVKILDFGIAKIRRSSDSDGTLRTQTGLIMGSPAYMSPEQCKDSADVDLRSDIYSFATIVYKMLAGRTPFLAASGTEMLFMHLTETPPPLRELVADLPAQVEAAIMRGLARARENRFDSMASFIGALRGEVGRGAAALARTSPTEELPVVAEIPLSAAERTLVAQPVTEILRAPGEGGAATRGDTPLVATRRLPAAGASPVSRAERSGTGQPSTTFSRATGEIGTADSDEMPLVAARSRRWSLFAFGGLAVAGLALLLLVRPGPGRNVPNGPSTESVTATATETFGSTGPPPPELPRDAGVSWSRADGGAATQIGTGTGTGKRTAPYTKTKTHTKTKTDSATRTQTDTWF
jgi:tRNA A-37 threonylcarbamoyl transferase component Bud32